MDAQVTNEEVLCDVLGPEAAPLFTWLARPAIHRTQPLGIFPHDLAREVLEADLRWRDPTTYLDVHNRLRDALVGRIPGGRGLQQQAAYFELMYLVRHAHLRGRSTTGPPMATCMPSLPLLTTTPTSPPAR